MDQIFSFAVDWVKKLQSGAFDGRVTQEVARLTREQLEQVVQLLAENEWSLRDPPHEPTIPQTGLKQ